MCFLASLIRYQFRLIQDLGGWLISPMIDPYAKFTTENLSFVTSRIELSREGSNVMALSRFCHFPETE